jgi:hypothetical protein
MPVLGYLGSNNLTMAGLSGQGELNMDVLDNYASKKLSDWFEDRWNDHFCMDISNELAQIIEESWARETLIPPEGLDSMGDLRQYLTGVKSSRWVKMYYISDGTKRWYLK